MFQLPAHIFKVRVASLVNHPTYLYLNLYRNTLAISKMKIQKEFNFQYLITIFAFVALIHGLVVSDFPLPSEVDVVTREALIVHSW